MDSATDGTPATSWKTLETDGRREMSLIAIILVIVVIVVLLSIL